MEYLIDPRGTWSRWPDENLAYRLGYPQPDFDLAGYAARNMGYVWLLIERGMTLLQFRAGMVSSQAVGALRPYLSKATADAPVALVYYASGWMEEAFTEPAPLIARFQMLAGMREPRQREKFICKALNEQSWPRRSNDMLGQLFGLWRERAGRFDSDVNSCLERIGLAERTLIAERNDNNSLTVLGSGRGFTIYDNYSMRQVIGHTIADQPDKAYGRWVEEAYRSCLAGGDPAIDDVDAIIEQPEHDARRRRYRRLILRWRKPDGGYLLSGSSQLRQDISIPLDLSMQ